MGIYAVVTIAGSSGKTTTAVTLATLLALHGRRVRLIDFDPQATATTWLGIELAPGQRTVADTLTGHTSLDDVTVAAPRVDGLAVVPAARSTLDTAAVALARDVSAVFGLHDALEASRDDADHTIIDCAGRLDVLTIAAMLATQAEARDEDFQAAGGKSGVITCTQPAPKENEGIAALNHELAKISRTYRRQITTLAVIPCAVPPATAGDAYAEQLEDVHDAYGELVTPGVRRTVVVPEAYSHRTPLPLYGHRAKPVNSDYHAVLTHLRGRGCLR